MSKTEKNLQEAFAGESQAYEFEKMYPLMIKDAEAEGNKSALQSFQYANEVEKIHAELYRKALENFGKNPEVDYYVCQVCGNTIEGEPPDKCHICGAVKKMFKKIE